MRRRVAAALVSSLFIPSCAPPQELRLPRVSLDLIDQSGSVDFGDLGGQSVVINFWASWCAPCVKELPAFDQVAKQGHVRFIGVDTKDAPIAAAEFLSKHPVSFELVKDPDAKLFNSLKLRAMPTTLFVKGDGRVAHIEHGPISRKKLSMLITRVLAAS